MGRMDWKRLSLRPNAKALLKEYLHWALEARAPLTAFAKFAIWSALTRGASAQLIRSLAARNALAALAATSKTNHFGELRNFYRWCVRRGKPGYTLELQLDMDRMGIPYSPKLVDPRSPKGHLTPDEERRIIERLDSDPDSGLGAFRNQTIVHIAWELGCRPSQLASLSLSDFHVHRAADVAYYSLSITRVKQRSEGIEKRTKSLSTLAGERVSQWIALASDSHSSTDDSRPLFTTIKKSVHGFERMVRSVMPTTINAWLTKFVRLDGRRAGAACLRHHMAQKLADLGYSKDVIADVLDHSNSKSVRRYVKARHNIAEIKTRALGLNPVYPSLVAWLEGRVFVASDTVERGKSVRGLVTDRYIGNIGACGLLDLTACFKAPVYACYGCEKFIPFIDGAHQEVISALESASTKALEKFGSTNVRAATAYEVPLMAARAVKNHCDSVKAQKSR